MKVQVDHNHLVSIAHPEIPQLKEYTYFAAGWKFSDWDKGMVVLHKKDFKLVNLKHLGDGMQVIYVKNSEIDELNLDIDMFKQWFGIFHGFDEETGKKYSFLPNFPHKDIDVLNKKFISLGVDLVSEISPKWVLVNVEPVSYIWDSLEAILSFLFALFLVYGKFEIKKFEINNEEIKKPELLGVKIQVPLFGQYLKYQEQFDGMIEILQHAGIFVKTDVLDTNNWVVYQISTTDYELLEVFAKWYESIEKIEKISKRDFTAEMKAKLLVFLAEDTQIPQDGKEDVIALIESWVVKFLAKQ
jgi:hypothetical protein